MASKRTRIILVVVIPVIASLELAFLGLLRLFNQNKQPFVDSTYVATNVPTEFVPNETITGMTLVLRKITYFEYLRHNNVNVIHNKSNEEYFAINITITLLSDEVIALDTQFDGGLHGLYMCKFELTGREYTMRYSWMDYDRIWIDHLYNVKNGEIDYSSQTEVDIYLKLQSTP